MIKEYVKSIPGGKQYIQAQISLNRGIGAAVGALSSLLLTINMLVSGVSWTDVFLISILLITIIFLIGIIIYYYYINKADNIYMQSMKNPS